LPPLHSAPAEDSSDNGSGLGGFPLLLFFFLLLCFFCFPVFFPPAPSSPFSFFPFWDCVGEESFWSVLSNSPALDEDYDGKGPGAGGWLDPSFLWFCFFPVLFRLYFFLLISGSSFSAGTKTIARLILVSVLLLPFLSFSLWIYAFFALSLLCFSSPLFPGSALLFIELESFNNSPVFAGLLFKSRTGSWAGDVVQDLLQISCWIGFLRAELKGWWTVLPNGAVCVLGNGYFSLWSLNVLNSTIWILISNN